MQPIIDARDEIKAAIRRDRERDDPDEDRLAELEGQSGALKWILVACFGNQGFSNAKFGRIECHEAINAFAREILLTAKQQLEAGGWRVEYTDSPEQSLEYASACVVVLTGTSSPYSTPSSTKWRRRSSSMADV